jgi:hypothetical protein
VVRAASRTRQCHAPNSATAIVRHIRSHCYCRAFAVLSSTDLVAELLDGPHVRQLERPVHLEPPTPCRAQRIECARQSLTTAESHSCRLRPRPRLLPRERRQTAQRRLSALRFVCLRSKSRRPVRVRSRRLHAALRCTARHGTARPRPQSRPYIHQSRLRAKTYRQRPSAHTILSAMQRTPWCAAASDRMRWTDSLTVGLRPTGSASW